MKKMLVLLAILSVVSIASASFSISVDADSNPTGPVQLTPSGTVNLGLFGAGNPEPGDSRAFFLLVQGLGVTSGGTAIIDVGTLGEVRTQSAAAWATELGGTFDSVGYVGVTTATSMVLASTNFPIPAYNGQLVDSIAFHCEGPGSVTLTLVSDDFLTVYDTQTITQVPEPATMILLSIGGLLLKRRK